MRGGSLSFRRRDDAARDREVPATLMVRLGLEALINEWVRLRGRVGGVSPRRKMCTLVAGVPVTIGVGATFTIRLPAWD